MMELSQWDPVVLILCGIPVSQATINYINSSRQIILMLMVLIVCNLLLIGYNIDHSMKQPQIYQGLTVLTCVLWPCSLVSLFFLIRINDSWCINHVSQSHSFPNLPRNCLRENLREEHHCLKLRCFLNSTPHEKIDIVKKKTTKA